MCVVSFVSDHYGQYPQNPKPFVWPAAAPASLPWSPDSLQLLKDIMEKMKQLDEKLGLANCEDPKKAEWMKSIEDRVSKLEGHTNG